jgi:tetratricopeptide (TPR) repeat protein
MARRLGFVHFERGAYHLARDNYARAAQQAEPGERVTILLGLAQARYRCGDYKPAVAVYRELLRRGQDLPEVLVGLAHCLLLSDGERAEAVRLASRAGEETRAGDVAFLARLTLAEAWLARGKRGKARKEFESLELLDHDRWLTARYHWVAALLAHDAGEVNEARRAWQQVVDLDGEAGLGQLAEERLADGERDSSA